MMLLFIGFIVILHVEMKLRPCKEQCKVYYFMLQLGLAIEV